MEYYTGKGRNGQDKKKKTCRETQHVKIDMERDASIIICRMVAIHTYGRLPKNFMTKKEAKKLGWEGGSLEKFAKGMCIGGDHFGNYEGILPQGNYRECDIDTLGRKSRGAKRIIYSDDGRIYYTDDHYETFELLYGEER